MNTSLTVKERTQQSWKLITLFSGILCAIFFGIFWYSVDPFWTGIVRLIAFGFFAVMVLGGLKLINAPLHVTLSATEELLLISYLKKDRVIQEEQFERDTIKKIVTAQAGKNLLLSYLQPDARTFKINFTDTDRELYLFEFSGRPLLFGPTSQKEIKEFLKGLGISL